MPDPGPLQQAIAGLDAFRPALGDAAIDDAIAALRRHGGAADGTAATPASADAPPAQRLRQVSILFADVADSTAMLGRVGTEEAMDLLGRAVQGFAEAVRAWGGEVLRFTGDGVKAAFGTRGVREDEAERAVRAGLQILDGAARHAAAVQRDLGIAGFGVRVGIHTGAVLLGGGAEAERGAMGHAVHLAARMEQSAPVGRLRISEDTWAQVRGLFDAEPQPPLLVKGHAQPLASWLVSGAARGPEPAVQRGVEGIASPMVGRDAELARLLALHAQAAGESRTTAALVIGEAGIGKTRLRRELLAALALGEGDAGLLQARAQPSGQLQPYGLLRQLVARWIGLHDDEPADAARRRLVERLGPWLGPAPEPAAARIGALIGLDFGAHPAVQALGPAALQAEAFAALRHALQARARHAAPLLLVFDDLHWADEASLAFVRTLLAPADVPLLLLLQARPALLERGPALEAAAGLVLERIALGALGGAGGRELLQALLAPLQPALPAPLEALLLERAGGNPYFLEALVQMLIDDGVIDARQRPWRLDAKRLDARRVPQTLLGVLQARLDALPPAELAALQRASIVGAVFWRDALRALDAEAPAALPALVRRGLLVARATSAFAGTEELAFSHQLLHDTTYGTVLKGERREGHAAAARWLAARVSERKGEFLAITAEHHERAGDSAQALEYWDHAMSDAFRRFASQAALDFNRRALAQPALADVHWRYMLLSNRSTLLDRLGRSAEAAETREQMQAWAEQHDDDAMRAEQLSHRMLQADHDGRPDEAAAVARRIVELAAAAEGTFMPSAAALAHGELAWLALQRHDHAEVARQVAAGTAQARAAARVPKRHGGYAAYEQQLGAIEISALIEQERHAAALDAARRSRERFDERTLAYDRFNLLQRECLALRHLGRLDEAAEVAAQLTELAQQMQVARLAPAARDGAAWVWLWRGELGRLEAELMELERLAACVDQGFELPGVRELQGRLAAARGDTELARRHWLDASAAFAAQGRGRRALPMLAALAAVDRDDGRDDAARAAVEQLLADAQADGRAEHRALPPPALLDCWRVLAALDDPRAAMLGEHLALRLDEQLGWLPDAAARQQLLAAVPHWRDASALLGRTGAAAGGPLPA